MYKWRYATEINQVHPQQSKTVIKNLRVVFKWDCYYLYKKTITIDNVQ